MSSLPAFLTGAAPILLNTPGRQAHTICPRRCVAPRRALVLSATTAEEPKAEPLSPLPPPQRPIPAQPPSTPPARSFKSPNDAPLGRPQRPQRTDRRQDRFQGPGQDRRPDRPRFDQRSRPGDRDFRPSHGRDDRPPPPAFVPDPDAVYYTKCGKCAAVYEVEPSTLSRGRKVACSVCGNEWFQRPDRLLVLDSKEEAFKPYPEDQKDELIRAQEQKRRDRYRGSREGGGRNSGERREGGGNRRGPRAGNSAHSVFIGNLPFSVAEEELEALLATKVQVRRLFIVKDPSGRSKGFGFADVASEDEVNMLVNSLNGHEIGGRNISVRVGNKN